MPDKDAPIQIVAYDAQWVRLFLEEREILRRVLSPWLTGPIEHIGSTAVPGLSAKPVINIIAAVGTLDGSRDAIPALRSVDYLHAPYREDVMHWFCKPHPSFRTHHLHLIPHGSPLWTARIVFRDRLRENRDLAAEYAELKRSLAASFPQDREIYGRQKRICRQGGWGEPKDVRPLGINFLLVVIDPSSQELTFSGLTSLSSSPGRAWSGLPAPHGLARRRKSPGWNLPVTPGKTSANPP
ncbi:MAG TPA: GrpB family protein [Opitutaceae bacterium]|nr:GrpB family protein [Opitutaceae bacterium]HWA10284.1 GrpB family protein [Opitutaceae bacterium]